MIRFIMALLLLAPLNVAEARRLPPIPDAPAGAYRLGAGDEIRVSVVGIDQASTTYAIADTGTISMPLVGQLAVAQKTVPEAEALIVDALREKQLLRAPSVSIQIDKYRPFFILGEVQKPGQYPYVPGMSVLTAVSIAGGFTFRAQTKRAMIVRNAGGHAASGSARPETLVLPGDTIKIEEAWF